MGDRKDLLLVFIHGFLGSEDSFYDFPKDLQAQLSKTLGQVESKAFPTYDTKGNNEKAVMNLVDWLLINATTLQFKNVVRVYLDADIFK